jgi:hypothetical protein
LEINKMADIKFFANIFDENTQPMLIPHQAGSGIGFYGPGYGTSVPIGGRQTTTWLTNSDGTSNAQFQLNNTAQRPNNQVSINGANPIGLNFLPNRLCPLNVKFSHETSVRVQNAKLKIFDRNSIEAHASGVSTFVYEARHPSADQSHPSLSWKPNSPAPGVGVHEWVEFDPSESMFDMLLTSSPGPSGTNGSSNDTPLLYGAATIDGAQGEFQEHDWFIALSVEPHEIGSKLFGLYFSCEYV